MDEQKARQRGRGLAAGGGAAGRPCSEALTKRLRKGGGQRRRAGVGRQSEQPSLGIDAAEARERGLQRRAGAVAARRAPRGARPSTHPRASQRSSHLGRAHMRACVHARKCAWVRPPTLSLVRKESRKSSISRRGRPGTSARKESALSAFMSDSVSPSPPPTGPRSACRSQTEGRGREGLRTLLRQREQNGLLAARASTEPPACAPASPPGTPTGIPNPPPLRLKAPSLAHRHVSHHSV